MRRILGIRRLGGCWWENAEGGGWKKDGVKVESLSKIPERVPLKA